LDFSFLIILNTFFTAIFFIGVRIDTVPVVTAASMLLAEKAPQSTAMRVTAVSKLEIY
jgi:hypothetical protein